MYGRCIFCSASLGSNRVIEEFPVGSRLAIDPAKGRLWAVCLRCARWNLAPIEERWEAIESAEKLFHHSRLRVHSENIGLAKLPDGTGVIRVGDALPGEVAAWRYGAQLLKRRARYLWTTAGVVTVAAAVAGGLAAAGAAGMMGGMVHLVQRVRMGRQNRRVVHRVDAAESPTGDELWLRRADLNGARLLEREGEPTLLLPAVDVGDRSGEPGRVVLAGDAAAAALGKVMVVANEKGAGRGDVSAAVDLLIGRGGPEALLRHYASRESALGVKRLPMTSGAFGGGGTRRFISRLRGEKVPFRKIPASELPVISFSLRGGRGGGSAGDPRSDLRAPERLALEMALHEETERRAMQGELALLAAAWREAEEIAAIADTLSYAARFPIPR
jgi:hypothetical protein